jgi:predicted metal-dependent phosphoesterase TrpH
MQLFEYSANLHMHTPYSDGEWYHAQIAEAAIRAGLDLICVTDHNVWVKGPEHYYEVDGARVLVLVGEEIHDSARRPQKNHLLAYNHRCELARLAPQPQRLIDAVRREGGLAFLAHPHDPSIPLLGYDEIAWVDWDVTGYAGIEVWNYMSDWARPSWA